MRFPSKWSIILQKSNCILQTGFVQMDYMCKTCIPLNLDNSFKLQGLSAMQFTIFFKLQLALIIIIFQEMSITSKLAFLLKCAIRRTVISKTYYGDVVQFMLKYDVLLCSKLCKTTDSNKELYFSSGVSNSNYSEGHMRTCKVTRGPHHPR